MESKHIVIVVGIVVLMILSLTWVSMRHAEKMSELGFCRTQKIGGKATLWAKCK